MLCVDYPGERKTSVEKGFRTHNHLVQMRCGHDDTVRMGSDQSLGLVSFKFLPSRCGLPGQSNPAHATS